jgi:hypothetical protein
VGECFCSSYESQQGDKNSGVHGVFSEFLFECEKSEKNEENTESAGDERGFMSRTCENKPA